MTSMIVRFVFRTERSLSYLRLLSLARQRDQPYPLKAIDVRMDSIHSINSTSKSLQLDTGSAGVEAPPEQEKNYLGL